MTEYAPSLKELVRRLESQFETSRALLLLGEWYVVFDTNIFYVGRIRNIKESKAL